MTHTYTPAPWTLETVKTTSGICHKIGPFPWRPHKQNHACLYVDYPGNGPVEAELLANAKLIASAPDLLQSLQWAIQFAEKFAADHNDGPTMASCIAQARAAIARATGGQA